MCFITCLYTCFLRVVLVAFCFVGLGCLLFGVFCFVGVDCWLWIFNVVFVVFGFFVVFMCCVCVTLLLVCLFIWLVVLLVLSLCVCMLFMLFAMFDFVVDGFCVVLIYDYWWFGECLLFGCVWFVVVNFTYLLVCYCFILMLRLFRWCFVCVVLLTFAMCLGIVVCGVFCCVVICDFYCLLFDCGFAFIPFN